MRIATFNVNSLKLRLDTVLSILKKCNIDVMLLQEIKGNEDIFPHTVMQENNINVQYKLQKAYNGVATLSPTYEVNMVRNYLYNKDDSARFLHCIVNDIHIINVYVPNGNPVDSEKFIYKIEWQEHLYNYIYDLFKQKEHFVLAGDFNIIPYEKDAYNINVFNNNALYRPETKKLYFELLNLGLVDCFNLYQHSISNRYTWWDYRNKSYDKNHGVRIDHIFASPKVSENITNMNIEISVRSEEKPSDHAPVWIDYKK